MKLEAPIGLQGKKDSDKDNLHTKGCTCLPIGISIVASTATIKKLQIAPVVADSVFL